MNVAIVLTGFVRRNFPISFQRLFQSLPKDWNFHIYGAVWNKTEYGERVPSTIFHPITKGKENIQFYDCESYESGKKLFQLKYDRKYPIKFIMSLPKAEIFSRFMDVNKEKERGTHCGFTNEAIEYWFNRIKDQYYLVREAFATLPVNFKYDLLIRFRTDFFLTKQFSYLINDYINIIFGYDCFQYGNHDIMMTYSKLYDHIDKFKNEMSLLNKYGYDTFNAENTLRYYLKTQGVSINELPWIEGEHFILGR